MRLLVRYGTAVILLVLIASPLFLLRAEETGHQAGSVPEITYGHLEDSLINFHVLRRQFHGISLNKLCSIKYFSGDDPRFATPRFNDSNWELLESTDIGSFDLNKIYWCRARFGVQPGIMNKPLVLHVFWQGAMEVYQNGRLIYSFGAFNTPSGQIVQDDCYFPMRKVTLYFDSGNDENLLAFRFGSHSNFMNLMGSDVLNTTPSVEFSLHNQKTAEAIETFRLTDALYYGFFMGTNCIIILLTLFQVKRRKIDLIQLYFGLFTLFTALVALTNIIDKGAFEFANPVVVGISALNSVGYTFSTYFLLLVLRQLFDQENRITLRLYTALAVVMLFTYYFATFTGRDLSTLTLILHFISFVEVMRLSLRSVRNHAYGSWIIVTGAFTFIIGGPVLEQIFNAIHMSGALRPFWATLTIRITFYLSMPISLSVFLAVNTLRSNRLLARQRDELDLEVHERTNELRLEKKKSDDLLLNILPAETAEELKQSGTTKAKDFNTVTVLFTDFKNFSLAAEKMTAQELVNEINYCYSEFDKIISKYGIEKIKTIGDAYMCAGGLPVPNKTNAEDTVRAAIEIRDFMLSEKKKREAQGKTFFEIRIGCHTGPVIAGIVGIKKFAYDIWGDTVNVASRMESSGEAGKINISGTTYDFVKDKFKCVYRGKIQAKNKGEIYMYFAEAK